MVRNNSLLLLVALIAVIFFYTSTAQTVLIISQTNTTGGEWFNLTSSQPTLVFISNNNSAAINATELQLYSEAGNNIRIITNGTISVESPLSFSASAASLYFQSESFELNSTIESQSIRLQITLNITSKISLNSPISLLSSMQILSHPSCQVTFSSSVSLTSLNVGQVSSFTQQPTSKISAVRDITIATSFDVILSSTSSLNLGLTSSRGSLYFIASSPLAPRFNSSIHFIQVSSQSSFSAPLGSVFFQRSPDSSYSSVSATSIVFALSSRTSISLLSLNINGDLSLYVSQGTVTQDTAANSLIRVGGNSFIEVASPTDFDVQLSNPNNTFVGSLTISVGQSSASTTKVNVNIANSSPTASWPRIYNDDNQYSINSLTLFYDHISQLNIPDAYGVLSLNNLELYVGGGVIVQSTNSTLIVSGELRIHLGDSTTSASRIVLDNANNNFDQLSVDYYSSSFNPSRANSTFLLFNHSFRDVDSMNITRYQLRGNYKNNYNAVNNIRLSLGRNLYIDSDVSPILLGTASITISTPGTIFISGSAPLSQFNGELNIVNSNVVYSAKNMSAAASIIISNSNFTGSGSLSTLQVLGQNSSITIGSRSNTTPSSNNTRNSSSLQVTTSFDLSKTTGTVLNMFVNPRTTSNDILIVSQNATISLGLGNLLRVSNSIASNSSDDVNGVEIAIITVVNDKVTNYGVFKNYREQDYVEEVGAIITYGGELRVLSIQGEQAGGNDVVLIWGQDFDEGSSSIGRWRLLNLWWMMVVSAVLCCLLLCCACLLAVGIVIFVRVRERELWNWEWQKGQSKQEDDFYKY